MQRLTSIIALVLLGACGGNGGGGTGGAGGNDDPASCEQQPSQALSQACCTAHGIDACGASLFCAAFDGRTQATCYAERSRADQQECSEDRQCMSGSCNTDEGACRSTPSTKCDPAIGCATDPAGARYACVAETSTCRRIGDGSYGSICEQASDCDDRLTCSENLCEQKEAVCGVFSGEGPCFTEPGGTECRNCRLTPFFWSDAEACESTFDALYACGTKNDCIDWQDTVDLACIIAACDAQVCAHEGCAVAEYEEYVPVCY